GKDADDDCFTGKRDCAIASPKTTVNTSRTHKRKGMPAITFTNEITHLRTIKRRRESQLKTLYWGTLNLGNMKEQRAIVEAFRKTDLESRKLALATVVKVRGSSYRSPGARMLISDDGKWVGSISGGCLEGDALRKARKVMHDQSPTTVTYDTSEDSNQNLGIGLGCNGIIDVLIEPVRTQHAYDPIAIFERLIPSKEPMALATIYSNTNWQSEKLLVNSRGEALVAFSEASLNAEVLPELKKVFDTRRSEAKTF